MVTWHKCSMSVSSLGYCLCIVQFGSHFYCLHLWFVGRYVRFLLTGYWFDIYYSNRFTTERHWTFLYVISASYNRIARNRVTTSIICSCTKPNNYIQYYHLVATMQMTGLAYVSLRTNCQAERLMVYFSKKRTWTFNWRSHKVH